MCLRNQHLGTCACEIISRIMRIVEVWNLCETSLADVMMADQAHLKEAVVDHLMVFDGGCLKLVLLMANWR